MGGNRHRRSGDDRSTLPQTIEWPASATESQPLDQYRRTAVTPSLTFGAPKRNADRPLTSLHVTVSHTPATRGGGVGHLPPRPLVGYLPEGTYLVVGVGGEGRGLRGDVSWWRHRGRVLALELEHDIVCGAEPGLSQPEI